MSSKPYSRAEELVEQWINGNREDVFKEVRKARKGKAILAVGIHEILRNNFGEDEAYNFSRGLLNLDI